MPRDEATVDRIFAGNLDDLPPLSSKVRLLSSFQIEIVKMVLIQLFIYEIFSIQRIFVLFLFRKSDAF